MSTATPSVPNGSIGERFNPLAGSQLEDPYSFYAEARRDEPVFFSEALRMWCVTRYDDARTVMGNPALFSAKESLKSIVEICPEALTVLAAGVSSTPTAADSDPPGHARWRKPLSAAFSASRMRRLEPQIREITHARIDAMLAMGHADVLADLAYPVPLQVIGRLCGIGDEHLDRLKHWGQSFEEFMFSQSEPDRQVVLARDMVEYQLFMRDHIERKRAEPGEDVTSELIAGGGDQPFSEGELVSQMVGLFVAGHETSAHLIGNALHLLLVERARWRQVVADPSLIPTAVEETLRNDAPVPTFLRTATADTDLAGKKIAAGDRLVVIFASANRDPKQFPDPDLFDLHRRNAAAHMTFGHGIHFCVGAPLARLEARVVLEVLVERIPSLRLVPGQLFRHIPQLVFHGFEKLEVEWE